MSGNVLIEYLYRDASNYKFWGSVTFANPAGMDLGEVEKRIRISLKEHELFIAHQVRIPDVFPFSSSTPTEDDHCFHELSAVELTKETPNDVYRRRIDEVVKEFEDEARWGWRAFDPVFTVR